MKLHLAAAAALMFGLHVASAAHGKDLTFRTEGAGGNSVTITRSASGDLNPDAQTPQLSVFQRLSKVLADFSPWSGPSLAATPVPGASPGGRSARDKAAKDVAPLSCSVAVNGKDPLKTVAIKLTANAPLDGEVSLEAVMQGRGRTTLSTALPVQQRAGETVPYEVGRTNVAPDAKLTGSVIVNGAVFRCS